MQLPTDCVQHVASQGPAPLWQKTDHTAPEGCLMRLSCLSRGWLGKGAGSGVGGGGRERERERERAGDVGRQRGGEQEGERGG